MLNQGKDHAMTRRDKPVVLAVAPDPPSDSGWSVKQMLGKMPNAGIQYLAAVLEQNGYPCVTFDWQGSDRSPLELVNEILAKDPSLVGFTLYDATIDTTRHAISMLRLVYSGPIVVGGYTPTFHAEDILREWPDVEYVVVREGEAAIVALMEHLEKQKPIEDVPNLLYRKNGSIQRNPEKALQDVTQLPWMKREWPETGDVTPIITRRGCMSRCSFCSMVPFYDSTLGPLVRARRPGDVIDEIEYCLSNGATEFMFYDDDFGLSSKQEREWVGQFLNEVGRRGLNFHWSVELRIADVIRGESILRELCDVGLEHISLGMESVLPRQLKLYNKGYTQADVFKGVGIAKTLPVDFQTNVIFWDPWSTLSEAAEQLELMDQVGVQDQLGNANFSLFSGVLLARKGTKMFSMLSESGRLRLRPGTFCEYKYDFYDDQVAAFHSFPMWSFHKRARQVARPPVLWRAVPRLERAGKKELAAAYRAYAKAVTHAEFDYFRALVTTFCDMKSWENIKEVAEEIRDEFGPRIDKCANLLPVPVMPQAHATHHSQFAGLFHTLEPAAKLGLGS
jgi:anaerobic magnesium-protoporphyrin IX monomethyl ester cyclase